MTCDLPRTVVLNWGGFAYAPRRNLTTSGGMLDCHNLGVGWATGIQRVEARDAATRPAYTGRSSQQRIISPHIGKAKAEKPCSRTQVVEDGVKPQGGLLLGKGRR